MKKKTLTKLNKARKPRKSRCNNSQLHNGLEPNRKNNNNIYKQKI